MRLNEYIAISTSTILLVPYSHWHVPRYHEWMQDEEIQQATASEPLTLEEEYSMQRSWRQDQDKLTFIICLPRPASSSPPPPSSSEEKKIELKEEDDVPTRMLGDINLFLRIDEGDEQDPEAEAQDPAHNAPDPQIIGEIELMIAEKTNHRRGFGRAALLTFLRYLVEHETEILEEFVPSNFTTDAQKTKVDVKYDEDWRRRFSYLSVKIGAGNVGSLGLFESVGFVRVSETPNVFGELELRRGRGDLGGDVVREALGRAGVEGYAEVDYRR